jgi:hypothetical protein
MNDDILKIKQLDNRFVDVGEDDIATHCGVTCVHINTGDSAIKQLAQVSDIKDYVKSRDTFLFETLRESVGDQCSHICTGNCRREGCNCICGEWHSDELNETKQELNDELDRLQNIINS